MGSLKEFVLIPLANNKGFAKVSPEDIDRVKSLKWRLHKKGYATTTIGRRPNRKIIHMHRIILELPKGAITDHINKDRLDNRRCNLRQANHSQNMANQYGHINERAAKYKGVYYMANIRRWGAIIRVNKKAHHLGLYDLQEDAARAYDSAATYFYKEYACTNFIDAVPLSPEEILIRTIPRRKRFSVYLPRGCSKWAIRIRRKGVSRSVGGFDTEESAMKAAELLSKIRVKRNDTKSVGCQDAIIASEAVKA